MKIKYQLYKAINKLLDNFNIRIERKSYIEFLEEKQKNNQIFINQFGLLKYLEKNQRLLYIENLRNSKSQLKQDLFVLGQLSYKKNGFFVEFGATNGIDLSNTYILEKDYSWSGILAEPCKSWHEELKKNRNCKIEKSCIWKKSGEEILFNESNTRELSTIDYFKNMDFMKNKRTPQKKYLVKTLSLEDLLIKYDAPKLIDYLSIDTEGSEYQILKSFEFDNYKFKVISVEHNYSNQREKIYDLLTQKGYIRKFQDLSGFDDWYVLN